MIEPADGLMFAVVLAVATALAAVGAARREAVALKAWPFDLKQVRLLDGPSKDARERCRKYLHALGSDRLPPRLATQRRPPVVGEVARALGGAKL